jgi:long-chain acyl-CoA synthetase
MNIHVADLEAALSRQLGITNSAVVPCTITQTQEPVAVVLFSGDDEALAAAIRTANSELADYQQMRRWLRWPEMGFPYTSTGKLLRRRIAEWACSALAGQQINSPDGEEQDSLLRIITEITGSTPANATDTARLSEDLGLDSLSRVQLQSTLEQRFAIELPDQVIEELGTLGELRAMLRPTASMSMNTAATAATQEAATAASGKSGAQPNIITSQEPHVYPHWPWRVPISWLRVLFIETVMRPLVWLLAAPRVVRENHNLPDGPLLIIANHVTSYDAALVLYALPPKLRHRVAIAMSAEMLLAFRRGRRQSEFALSFLGPLAWFAITSLFNVFPLPRSSGFRQSFAHAGEAMDHGYSVMVFPEGHRSEDGGIRVFRPGIGLLSDQSRTAILPVALKGLGELKQQGRGWFRSGRLSIRVGEPVRFAPGIAPAAMTRQLEDAVRRLIE